MTLNKSQAISRVESFPSVAQCTVFFDGACPVRSLEIAAYRLLKGGHAFKPRLFIRPFCTSVIVSV